MSGNKELPGTVKTCVRKLIPLQENAWEWVEHNCKRIIKPQDEQRTPWAMILVAPLMWL